jgi:hypothetical protein
MSALAAGSDGVSDLESTSAPIENDCSGSESVGGDVSLVLGIAGEPEVEPVGSEAGVVSDEPGRVDVPTPAVVVVTLRDVVLAVSVVVVEPALPVLVVVARVEVVVGPELAVVEVARVVVVVGFELAVVEVARVVVVGASVVVVTGESVVGVTTTVNRV